MVGLLNVKCVTPKAQTEVICLAAIKRDRGAIKYVTPKAQTKATRLEAVERDKYALQYGYTCSIFF